MSYPEISRETVAYFLSEYPLDSPPARLVDVIEEFALRSYSQEKTEAFLEASIDKIQRQLVDEFNNRFQKASILRFHLLDEVGDTIRGAGFDDTNEKLVFQEALREIAPSDFEKLSAYVLKLAGCESYWNTPESHDQGLDAFGHATFFVKAHCEWLLAKPRLTMLAQAKHFNGTKIGTGDIREFIGSAELARHKIFAVYDEKYLDLEILPWAPLALVFITSEEIPRTVKLLSIRSGMIVLSCDDLFEVLMTGWTDRPSRVTKAWFRKKIASAIKNIPKAI